MVLDERSARILFGVEIVDSEVKYVKGQRGKKVTAYFIRPIHEGDVVVYGSGMMARVDTSDAADGFNSKLDALKWLEANNSRFLQHDYRRKYMEEYMAETAHKMKLIPFKDKDDPDKGIEGFAFFDLENVCYYTNTWRKVLRGGISKSELFPNKKLALLSLTNRLNREALGEEFDPKTFVVYKGVKEDGKDKT